MTTLRPRWWGLCGLGVRGAGASPMRVEARGKEGSGGSHAIDHRYEPLPYLYTVTSPRYKTGPRLDTIVPLTVNYSTTRHLPSAHHQANQNCMIFYLSSSLCTRFLPLGVPFVFDKKIPCTYCCSLRHRRYS